MEAVMDPFTAHAIAADRGKDFAAEAANERLVRAARRCDREPDPRPHPSRRPGEVGRPVTA
jgi:hypothetical protein